MPKRRYYTKLRCVITKQRDDFLTILYVSYFPCNFECFVLWGADNDEMQTCVESKQLQMVTWGRVSFQRFTVFTVHTQFLQDPCFLSGLLIAVRWLFLIPKLFLHSLLTVVLQPNAGVDSSFFSFYITHNDASQSVGLLWTSNQLVARTSTWQHTTVTTVKHPCPWLDSKPSKSSGLRLHGQWNRHICYLHTWNNPLWTEHTNNIWPTVQMTKRLKG